MKRWNAWMVLSATAVLLGFTACTQQERAAAPAVEDKVFALTTDNASLKVSFLAGELADLRVTERVEAGTGKVVDLPRLRAKLTLKNTSSDQAARLLSGSIEYMDAEGKRIPPAEGRGDTTFRFSSYQERLDPGMETAQDIEVPFPVVALREKKLRDIRFELSYIPTPYREETATIRVSVSQ